MLVQFITASLSEQISRQGSRSTAEKIHFAQKLQTIKSINTQNENVSTDFTIRQQPRHHYSINIIKSIGRLATRGRLIHNATLHHTIPNYDVNYNCIIHYGSAWRLMSFAEFKVERNVIQIRIRLIWIDSAREKMEGHICHVSDDDLGLLEGLSLAKVTLFRL